MEHKVKDGLSENYLVGLGKDRIEDIFEVIGIAENKYLEKAEIVRNKLKELSDDASFAGTMIHYMYWEIIGNSDDANSHRYYRAETGGNFETVVRMCDMAIRRLARLIHSNNINKTTIDTFESLYLSLYAEFNEILDRQNMNDFNCNGPAYKHVSKHGWRPKTEVLERFCNHTYSSNCVKIWGGNLI